MKVIEAAHAGRPEVLQLVERPKPVPGPGQLLVQVGVAGVNFADTKLRKDAYFVPAKFPFVPGVEVAGRVAGLGSGVTGWHVGDRVAGIRLDSGGGYAEFATLDVHLAVAVPDALDFQRAVAVLNQGLTAQGLVETAPEITGGASVLVTAAAGGVGGLLVQLARLAGARMVIAAAGNTSKLSDGAISYADADWPTAVRDRLGSAGVDVVMDAVGGGVRQAALRILAPRGRLIFYGSASGSSGIDDAALTQLLARSASLTGFAIHTPIRENSAWLARTLARLFALVANGQLLAPVHPAFVLADAAAAHAALESRSTTGKVLLTTGD